MVYFGSSSTANRAGIRHDLTAASAAAKRKIGIRGRMDRRRHVLIAAVVFAGTLALSAGAWAQSASTWDKRGREAEQREDYDAAFEAYRQARLLKPNDLRYKTHFERVRFMAAAAHVDRGRVLRQNGDLYGALVEFQRALAIDGGNQAAQQEIEQTQAQMAAAAAAQSSVGPPPGPTTIAAGPIELAPIATNPITLHMVEDTKVIYQAIGKMAGLNVIFDPDYTSRRIQVDLNSVSLQDAFRILGTQSGTFWKPITPNTIFVAQNTPTKRTELDQSAVQTFYLTNVAAANDANELLTALRNIFPPQVKIFLVPSQSAIVMRATPDQLALAKELLTNLDRAKPEVVVDVAVLSVSRDKARNLGITLPQSFGITPQIKNAGSSGSDTTTTNPTLTDLAHATGANFAVSIGSAAVNALLSDSDTRILQNPKVRATDGQRAQLKIGSKIPIATGSYNAGVSTGLASIGVQTQFTYQDVGVNIDMTPTVHQDREVTLKMKIEVSSQIGSVTISGVTEPIIGQNIIDQVIQLKEGEPSILAGILTKQESKALSGTPGLSDIPLIKYLFSSTERKDDQNEVVFLLIPHIVRESVLTQMNTRPIDTGSGDRIELRREVVPAAATAPIASNGRPVPTTAIQAANAVIGAAARSAAAAVEAAQRASAGGPIAQQNAAREALQAAKSAVAPVNFMLAPPDGNQASGSTFQMAVIASNAKDLYSVPLQVQFNPKVLQLVNVDSGELLGRDGQAVAVVHRDEGNGMVTISESRPPGVSGVTGEGSVAVLTFKAIGSGDSKVSLAKVGAKNSTQANMPAVGSQAVVHVK
ncbi:MAG: type II and III secretion system protein [Acidobacteria bacterium]|nr:type II and III secretion system protein [Acidobacteriota bacterium]